MLLIPSNIFPFGRADQADTGRALQTRGPAESRWGQCPPAPPAGAVGCLLHSRELMLLSS